MSDAGTATRRGMFRSIVISVLVSAAAAILFVFGYSRSPAGYVAVYTVAEMWLVCVVTVLFALVLLVFRKTRRSGTVALIGGLILPCLFILGVRVSEFAGWVLWANERMVPIGPDVVANEVAYFNAGATLEQINDFHDLTLMEPRPDGRGRDFKPGIVSYLGLVPSQAHGHDGFAIELSPSMPQESRDQLQRALEQSPLVFRVYHDIAPTDIPAP
jgi:hypothetical protein